MFKILEKMKITILGTGCSKCMALFQTVEKAVKELGIAAEIEKQEDMMKIMEYNVMTLPALVVDGKVVAKGPMSLEQVKECLTK
jgi:small redox-active disulfide protein 2